MKYRCYGCMNEYQMDSWVCPNCGYDQRTLSDNALHMRPGSLLSNRYLIGKVLGFGGFGVTYLAWDHVLQQRVAIKEYLPSEFATRAAGKTEVTIFSGNKAQQFADGMRKFVEEAKRLAKFQNEQGIVRIYDSFEANNTAYIIMEFLDGETLEDYLKRVGKVPVEKAIEMLSPVIKSLETVHKAGIIHRDIAPDNIFLTNDGQVKLIDFGAARHATTSHSRSLTVIIKPGYSPEEQYRSRGDQGPHTDVYALAAVLYRMITGETPPDALERRAYMENKKKDTLIPPSKYCKINKNQENAILNAMNIYAESRTGTAETLLNDLTSSAQIRRIKGKIKVLDLMKWPLWVKITVPTLGITAITAFVLLFTGVIDFGGNPLQVFTLGSDSVRVPNVVNSSIGVAQEKLEQNDLLSIISGREVSETVPANMVLRQGIDAGSVVDKGTEIDLYISAAPEIDVEPGLMPDLSYYTEEEARSTLEDLGAETLVEYEFSDDVAEGLVIRSSIGYGEPLPENEPVILYVSQGRNPAASEESGDDEQNASAQLNRSSLSLFVGDSVSLSASGGDGTFDWSSSNPSVAFVENGTVTALGKGSAIITVTSKGSSADCAVTVQDYSIALNESELNLFAGESKTLSVSGAPAGSSVTWNSSNSSVATVNDGNVIAHSNGSCTVTASFSKANHTYNTSCTVNVKASGVSLSKTSLSSMYVGDIETISASTYPAGRNVTWSTSNSRIATVSNGRITALSAGSATITASCSYGGVTYSETCSVTVRAVSLSLSTSELSMMVGENENLTATSSPGGVNVTWSSSNNSVASVNSSGKVSAIGSGSATIASKITVNGHSYTATCHVTVEEPHIQISSSSLSMNVGDTESLSASVFPNGSYITWSSSNTDVATVNNSGIITAISSGSATVAAQIKVSGKNYSSTCQVTVSPPSVQLSTHNLSMMIGDSETLSATVTPSGTHVSWESSNTDVATVYQGGKIAANGKGNATITAKIKINGITYSDSCNVVVEQKASPPSGYKLSAMAMDYHSSDFTLGGPGSMCQLSLSTLDYNERDYSTVKLYIQRPDGSTVSEGSSNNGTGTWIYTFDQIGTYIVYGEVSNEYGTYKGSSNESCIKIFIVEGEPVTTITYY